MNTLLWGVPVYVTALFKLALPFRATRKFFDYILNWLSYTWMYCNNAFIDLLKRVEYDGEGLEGLEMNEWYLVVANHRTWVDIALQKVFHGRIPFLKYFLKRELIWVPILGLAWWALDYPFMKRYTPEFLKTSPSPREGHRGHEKGLREVPPHARLHHELRGRDALHAGKARGPGLPLPAPPEAALRWHLLRPLRHGDRMRKLIDVTIHYPDGAENTWEFLLR